MPKKYTEEQKAKMREQAMAMKANGETQQKIAKAVGISPITLSKILNEGKKRAKAAKPAKVQKPETLFAELSKMEQRINAIDKNVAALNKEREDLTRKMKPLFDKVSATIFKK